ncbi:hypothetical protein HXY33_06175 [Candidatus Bathyarchaeota archaeon]|nr:hypothetical protein [Candidatus Bathyarchaeota archaeon]
MNTQEHYPSNQVYRLLMRKLLAWLLLYLIIADALSTFLSLLFFLSTIFPTQLEGSLYWISFGLPLILIVIGIASALPFSEFAYMREAGRNPVIARESIKHVTRRRERKEIGILMGIVGVTSILGMNPLYFLLSSLSSSIGMPGTTFVMIATLSLLIIIYLKWLHKYVKSENNQHDTY